jgi:hypothetical protein
VEEDMEKSEAKTNKRSVKKEILNYELPTSSSLSSGEGLG